MASASLSDRLLAWYDRHGRKQLPWKRARDAYKIWVSEIMLQQTQVATVIPYFERFITRFPDLTTLARAKPDTVLHLWTGLGYYARARNLHRAARLIVREHNGRIPKQFDAVCDLPGIGRSTAGAILALAFGRRHAILDGNVKRVLARYHAIAQPLNQRAVEQQLWALAEQYTPARRVADYTQAIMDLGATLCTRTQPDCPRCPLQRRCRARIAGNPRDFPARVTRPRAPVKQVRLLMIRDQRDRVLLTQRPPVGVWGGLWSLPECEQPDVRRWSRDYLGLDIQPETPWPVRRHSFSHFHLDITPIPARVLGGKPAVMETGATVWYNVHRPDARGLAAPVKRLLELLRNT